MRVEVKTQAEFDLEISKGNTVIVRAGFFEARGNSSVVAWGNSSVVACELWEKYINIFKEDFKRNKKPEMAIFESENNSYENPIKYAHFSSYELRNDMLIKIDDLF